MSFVQFKKALLRTVTAGVLAVLVVCQAATVRLNAGAASLQQQLQDNLEKQQQIKANISKLNKDKSSKQAIANEYKAQADNVQSRMDICNALIRQYNAEMDDLESEIEKKNQEIDQTKETFKKRLRAIQMSGDTAAVTLLLGADNLADFLAKAQLAKNVSAYDQKIINELVAAIQKIEADKKAVEEKQAKQKEISSQLADAQKEYAALLNEAQSKVAAVNADISDQKAALAKEEAAERRIEQKIKDSMSSNKDLIFTSFSFKWPLDAKYKKITSPYGYRIHPIYGTKKLHTGVDISGSGINGKPVYAAADGVVSVAEYDSSYGNHVIINHGTASDGKYYQTLYAHMTRDVVSVGQTVKKGQKIGLVGSTGASTGPHLHFEMRVNGGRVNPLNYVG